METVVAAADFRGARSSRAQVSASRRNELWPRNDNRDTVLYRRTRKVREGEDAFASARGRARSSELCCREVPAISLALWNNIWYECQSIEAVAVTDDGKWREGSLTFQIGALAESGTPGRKIEEKGSLSTLSFLRSYVPAFLRSRVLNSFEIDWVARSDSASGKIRANRA